MIIGKKGEVTNISAHQDAVYTRPSQFEKRTDTVYRRYIGD
jgi:hypothetical protein